MNCRNGSKNKILVIIDEHNNLYEIDKDKKLHWWQEQRDEDVATSNIDSLPIIDS